MKILKTIGFIFALAFVGILLISFFLPSKYTVKRTITIKTSPEHAYTYVNHLSKWSRWTVWTKDYDSTLNSEFSLPDSGAGAFMKWTSNSMGKGNLKVTKNKFPELVEFDLDIENGKFVSKGKITLNNYNEDTVIEWSESGELGWNPIGRIYAYFMIDKALGADYESSLAKLKKIIEL
jgi:hypothetical protein